MRHKFYPPIPKIKATIQLKILSDIKKKIAATKTKISTIRDVTVVSRLVGHVTFVISDFISCKYLIGFIL
jgi:hypothetical protein